MVLELDETDGETDGETGGSSGSVSRRMSKCVNYSLMSSWRLVADRATNLDLIVKLKTNADLSDDSKGK